VGDALRKKVFTFSPNERSRSPEYATDTIPTEAEPVFRQIDHNLQLGGKSDLFGSLGLRSW
jgi:hypothetical protein